MRLWSLHPRFLDARGIVALWREALLARAVLQGETKGYRQHPQLQRFRAHPSPLQAIDAYLGAVFAESQARAYAFDGGKFEVVAAVEPMTVSTGQIAWEWQHLHAKLSQRAPDCHMRWRDAEPACHPLFVPVAGPVESWEKGV